MKTAFRSIACLVLLISCATKEKEVPQLTNFQKDSIGRQKAIDIATQKYPGIYNLATIKGRYSIDYSPIINKGYQLLVNGSVHDIYIKDSIDYACVHVSAFHDFYLDLSITKEQEKLLLGKGHQFIYVISINKLQKAKVSLKIDSPDNTQNESSDDEDDEDVSVPLDATAEISSSEIFIGKGKLIDLIIKK